MEVGEKPVAAVINGTSAASAERWWKIADVGVFGLWISLVTLVLNRHEPWADEAQAWLIARDLDLRTIWFHELRYEGTPGLWHTLLWVAQHGFHAGYAWLSILGAASAAAGVAVVLWMAPFPRPLRYLLVFSYVMAYQYAVVARSYNLLAALLFLACAFFSDPRRPLRFSVTIALLALTSLHGMVLAVALGLCYLIQANRYWPQFALPLRRGYRLGAGLLVLLFVALYFVLKPTPDMLMFHPEKIPTVAKQSIDFEHIGYALSYPFFDHWLPSAIFLAAAGAWCWLRRNLTVYLALVAPMILIFVKVAGRPHHHGTIFLAAIAALWIAWPEASEQAVAAGRTRLALQGMIVLLAGLFGLNVWDASVAMQRDYQSPYSGALDAADFLKSVGADKAGIIGYSYGVSALEPYFDHNILANIPTTYTHYGTPFAGFVPDLDDVQKYNPEFIVVFSNSPRHDFQVVDGPFQSAGYRAVHYSPGEMFYKRTTFGSAAYLIYHRE